MVDFRDLQNFRGPRDHRDFRVSGFLGFKASGFKGFKGLGF